MDYVKEVQNEVETFSIALKNNALIEQEQFEKWFSEQDNVD